MGVILSRLENNVHTMKSRTRVILFSKSIGEVLVLKTGGFLHLQYTKLMPHRCHSETCTSTVRYVNIIKLRLHSTYIVDITGTSLQRISK
jgi:hypothetical protein